ENPWDLSPFSVTPAASLLSKCVSVGALSQVRTRTGPVFSSHLRKAEEQIRMQKQLDEVCACSCLGDGVLGSRRFQMLQMLGDHMQELLREQNSLRQRLMRPLAHTNLPVHAHLHRFVVESLNLMMDFIETLEENVLRLTAEFIPVQLLPLPLSQDSSHAQLLMQASEMETLSSQILQWKSVDGCSLVTSDP
uniref:HAUS augmin-like complex, subunit 2 n=1 Tax=Oreochromis niloticus TaxID=8128 RepID=A0A669C198_ORENI